MSEDKEPVVEEGEEAAANEQTTKDREVSESPIEEGEVPANEKADKAGEGFGRT